ncbi:hypothetical protein [Nocardia sp. alder85J]|uniref:hypothetical protein n=1 Tax=Nocardia sp. alder85J TaxID=2862949 RepID=UPI001CD30EB3|nr:hypothetical protein [Nocardia sp. alder85J]MCX4096203.1 hypothetical protein [Nocardia sp. alder85J]
MSPGALRQQGTPERHQPCTLFDSHERYADRGAYVDPPEADRPAAADLREFLATEPRITAAVFGQHWPDVLADKAKQITVPIEFDLQWDDEHISREEGLALFDAFASKEKSLHVNSGKHKDLPRFEADSAVRFFARHFGRAATSPA